MTAFKGSAFYIASMSEYASPVSSPPFKYTSLSGIYVDTPAYEGRHPRCSSSKIYDLLTHEDPGPAYTKTGQLHVHQPPKHKDESHHFYTAQLVHYGLKPLKTKSLAKKALLAAYRGSAEGLTVPESIMKIEKRLTAEFKKKNAAAEREHRQNQKRQGQDQNEQPKKRKRDENKSTDKARDDPLTSGKATKKPKTTQTPKDPLTSGKTAKVSKLTKIPKPTVLSDKVAKDSKSAKVPNDPVTSSKTAKEAKTIKSPKNPVTKGAVAVIPKANKVRIQTSRIPPIYLGTHAILQGPTTLNVARIQGTYTITAPSVSDGWDCGGPLTLKFAPSSTTSHLWGSFDFGVFKGILRSSPSIKPKDSTIRFLWRGRETGEGESTYGKKNVAEFKFLGNGNSFAGTMYWDCLGTFNVTGKLDVASSRNKVFTKNVPGWKKEYWSLNDSNYESEGVGRWGGGGGWGYRSESRVELNSDTGNEGAGEDSEDEESSGDLEY